MSRVANMLVDCKLLSGAVIKFPQNKHLSLYDCEFHPGSFMDVPTSTNVYVHQCVFDVDVFKNELGHISVGRKHSGQDLTFPSPCTLLSVWDGENAEELVSPLLLPKGVETHYHCCGNMKSATTIDSLIESLYMYPKLSIHSIKWKGTIELFDGMSHINESWVRPSWVENDELFEKLKQVIQYPSRMEGANMLALLSSICVKRLGTQSALQKLPLEMFKMCRSFLMA